MLTSTKFTFLFYFIYFAGGASSGEGGRQRFGAADREQAGAMLRSRRRERRQRTLRKERFLHQGQEDLRPRGPKVACGGPVPAGRCDAAPVGQHRPAGRRVEDGDQ